MNYEVIKFEQDGSLATITLNRPQVLNALSLQMETELAAATTAVKEDDSIRVLILTGAGRAFCAGGDVKDQGPGSRFDVPFHRRVEMIQDFHRAVLNIHYMRKPVIAMVNGYAIGAGCNLALCCDIRIASEKAKFSEIFRNVGLTGDGGGTYFLPRLIGIGKAYELYYTGDMIDAYQAKELGLVNQVVPENALKGKAYEFARKLANGPTFAFGLMKASINKGLKSDLETILEYEAMSQATCMESEDHREGVRAFKEKRAPVFKGK